RIPERRVGVGGVVAVEDVPVKVYRELVRVYQVLSVPDGEVLVGEFRELPDLGLPPEARERVHVRESLERRYRRAPAEPGQYLDGLARAAGRDEEVGVEHRAEAVVAVILHRQRRAL